MFLKRGAWKHVLVGMIVLAVLMGCKDPAKESNELPDIIEVSVNLSKNPAKVGEPILFEIRVTQGEETVTDANEIEFEFFQQSGLNKEKVKIKKAKDGVYNLEKSFDEEGTYYFIPHVTARGMHAMPREKFTITK